MKLNLNIIPILTLFSAVNSFIIFPTSYSARSKDVSLRVDPTIVDPSSFSQENFEIAAAATVAVLGGAGAVFSNQKGGESSPAMSNSMPKPEPIDVSIPYDAAARLAYGKNTFL